LDELNYDRYNKNAERIFRISSTIKFGGDEQRITQTSDMMGESLKKDYPEVEEYARIYTSSGNKLIKKGSEFINEDNVAHVDSTFFNIFTLPAVSGDTRTAINEPNTVVITASTAKKYFGTTEAVGKSIETNDKGSTVYKVTAVIKDIPQNSHFHFDFMFSMKNVEYQWGRHTSHNFHTYLLLKPGTNYKELEKKFDQYTEKYILPEAKQFMQISSMEDFKKAGNQLEYSLMPLTKLHLYSDFGYEISPSGNIKYVYIFSAVALLILLIACINFTNLTTARSANRAKEVGIRKVLGTERKNLITQFITESTLMSLLSLVIAVLLTYLALPMFNDIAAKSMRLNILFSPMILPVLIALPFVVGLLAGSYPAFYLSAFKPIAVLKGKLQMGSKSGGLRSLLVVFQFATSIFLIIGTIIIFRQLNFIQTKNLGFNKDQVLIIDDAYVLKKNTEVFKNEVLQLPGVISGTLSAYLPVSQSSRNDNTYSKEAVMDSKNALSMQTWSIDYDYLKTIGIELKRGRNFSKDFGTDSTGVIINESVEKLLGYSDPVGKNIYSADDGKGKPVVYTIIGVVKNFNFESLHETVGPLMFMLRRSTGLASFKVKPDNISALIKNIESKWKSLAPGMPFSYRFMDDSFARMYTAEQRVGKIALIFSVLAILIACLGLFGLATFIAEQRTKEIGIRKVLGASVNGIVRLLSKDFVKLVIVAFIIAAPLAWWAMQTWLQDFAYRISISWWIFLLAIGIALFIALATISFQAIKAAIANPVKNLRTE
jgi:putative ABC transport system permease protein